MTEVITNQTRFASYAANRREYDRLVARQGFDPCAHDYDPLTPFMVKLVGSDGNAFISDYDYLTLANYLVDREDWCQIIHIGRLIANRDIPDVRMSHTVYYAPAKEWRLITIQAYVDGTAWIVDDAAMNGEQKG